MNILTMRVSMDTGGQLIFVLLSMDPSERINQPTYKKQLQASFAATTGTSRERVGRALHANSEVQMMSIGAELAASVLPDDLREQLLKSTAEMLYLDLEEELIHFPWECVRLADRQWLGSRFVVGRHVRVPDGKELPTQAANKRFVIIADPDGTLATARAEGTALMAALGKRRSVTFLAAQVSKAELCEQTRDCAFFHYAGHSSEQGLHCADGILTADEVIELGLAPRMAFLNSCDSGYTVDGGSSRAGIVQAFLCNGSLALICTNSLIHSATAAEFADRFYSAFMSGECLGRSFAQAVNLDQRGLEWARYTIYGNPLYDGTSIRPKSLSGAGTIIAIVLGLLMLLGLAYRYIYHDSIDTADFNSEENIQYSACEAGSKGSCFKVATSLMNRGQAKRAMPILEASCNQGDRRSCTSLAVQYLRSGDYTRAKTRGDEGCAAKESHCLEYAMALVDRGLNEVADTLTLGLCDAGYDMACALNGQIQDSLGQRQASHKMHRRACDLGYKLSCARHALMAVTNDGDQSQLLLLKDYCDSRSVSGACTDYGSALVRLGRFDEAITAFDVDCSKETQFRILSCELAGAELLNYRPSRARAYLDFACKAGRSSACAKLALESEPTTANPCNGLELNDCREYGYRLQQNNDLSKAATIYEFVCANGGYAACNDAGVVAIKRANPAHAEKFYQLACQHNESMGCENLSGIIERKGDKAEALSIVSEACKKGLGGSCYRAALLKGVSPATASAIDYLKRACELKHPAACNEYGFSQRKKSDKSVTIESYKKACNSGMARACLNLGLLYSDTNKPTDAINWFAQACNGGEVNGCDLKQITEASELKKENRIAEAAAIMEKFCNEGRSDGCLDLGKLKLEMGDRLTANKAFLKSCHAGFNGSCALYGQQEMQQGRLEVASEFCGKACKGGSKDGCDCETAAKAKLSH